MPTTEDKLFNFRPALFAAFFLADGILFAYLRAFYGASAWWSLFPLPILLFAFFFSLRRDKLVKRLLFLLLFLTFFTAGFIGFRAQTYAYADCPQFYGEYDVTGTVVSRKRDEKGATRLVLEEVYVGGERAKGQLNAYIPPSFGVDIAVSERVWLRGSVRTNVDCFNDFGFRAEAIRNGTRYTAYAEEGPKVVGKSRNPLLLVRARMEEVVYAGMDETPAALTLGLLTGEMSGVGESLVANMRYGGISHIFAVSGLNVGALYLFCLFLFAKTPLRRASKPVRFCLLVGILFFYSGICGFSASVVRAAIFSAVTYFVRLLGTSADLLEGLGVGGILILLFTPSELFGVGFQLSFLACFGLFFLSKRVGQVFDELQKRFRKRFPRKYTAEEQKLLDSGESLPPSLGEKAYKGVSDVLSASIAAQITTAPVLLLHFGFLSGWSLLLNFIFVPLIDGIFTLLLLLVALACLLPTGFSAVLLYLPSLVWSASMLVFEIMDFSTFGLQNVHLTWRICVCYYGGVTFLSDKWNLRKGVRRGLAALFFLGFFACVLLINLGKW